MASSAQSAQQAATERKARRTAVSMDVAFREQGGKKTRVELLDVSTHGFRILTFAGVREDKTVWLSLPGLEGWQARVAWVRGDEAGCEFTQPLHPAVLNMLLLKARSS